MLTNTYQPHVGGVARSVEAFAGEFRRRGHRVVVVAPEFEGAEDDERDVVRVPALQKFNGSDFSVSLPLPGLIDAALADFQPDVIHSNHPFLLGDAAVRLSALFNVPVVFQHHTMYERYTHYVPGDSAALQQFVVELSTEYANLCDAVIAPSESVAAVLRQRGVDQPLGVIPTGVDVERFASGDGPGFRSRLGIPAEALVVGHLGRLAPEKNLAFLADAVSRFLHKHPEARFLVAGSGPSQEEIAKTFRDRKLTERLHFAGVCQGKNLVDAYHAMDVFAFASHTETQGMVLTEAMAAGCPVVALDAPGAREVVRDRRNGRLLHGERRGEFAAALAWVARLDAAKREDLRQHARNTAAEFSMTRCADRILALYQQAIDTRRSHHLQLGQLDESPWQAAVRRFSAEWDLWAATAHAARAALRSPKVGKFPGWTRLVGFFRRVRRLLSRNEWVVHLLGSTRSAGSPTDPGLIMIQVDGLSRQQFERAIRRGRMPFLRRLIRREHYHLHTHYSGVPSTTPSVQGELFYGVKQAVPAFGYRDHGSGQTVYMFHPGPAAEVQKRLAASGPGLLEGGSSWSNVFSGGAAEAHFCPACLGWGDLARALNPLSWALLVVLHLGSVLRIAGLLALETVLAVIDCIRGLIAGQDLLKELKFVPTRVGIVIVLRELITIGATADIARGLPVIHVNFLGYDEQSHRRGPNSAFAHWALGGIDGAIKRIWRAAHRSTRRDYQVWIYSDHGQEATLDYRRLTGNSLQQAVARVFEVPAPSPNESQRGVQFQRLEWLGGGRFRRWLFGRVPSPDPEEEKIHGHLDVVALGPTGHVYPPEPLSPDQLAMVAKRLVDEARIPMVLAAAEPGKALVWTAFGQFQLPDDASAVFGSRHEFLHEVAREMTDLCHHPDAGQLVVCGYQIDGPQITFPQENGAHCGPGRQETRGFALLPRNVRLPQRKRKHLRPRDLRQAAFRALGRPVVNVPMHPHPRERTDTVRVLTYNVHSCVGTDRRISPARIARLIAQCDPDIVALQEVDVRRSRTGDVDQAHAIARELEMEFHFHPALQVAEEQYGDAVLSRFPMRLVHAAALPLVPDGRHEPRGALWVAIDVGGEELQLINTHLGVMRRERKAQIDAMLSQQWLADPRFCGPRVLCGDFNCLPRSACYRRLCGDLCDAQLNLEHHRPKRTFPSRIPLGRIDHVFVGGPIEVVGIEVPRSHLARVASDHLPIIVELRLGVRP